MTEILFEDKNKNDNMPPNLVNLHTSLFSCYSHSGVKDEPDPASSTPKIGVHVSNFDDDSDVVTTQDGLAVTNSSDISGNKPFPISYDFSNEMDNERRESELSDETIG